jgi:hypothetical protein
MDADATSTLHKAGVSATDDSFKYIWFQVCPFIPENLHVAPEMFLCWRRNEEVRAYNSKWILL